jgi:predicted permease
VTALLLLRTFWNLTQVDAGFSRRGLLTFGLVLPNASYPGSQDRAAFYQRLLDRLASMPGVERAAAMSGLPPVRDVDANDTEFEGYKPGPGQPPANVDYYQWVTTGYLETMGIRVVEGRGFVPSDATSRNGVALVNETLAKRFWPGQSPINRRLRPGGPGETPWLTVVGVVADVKQGGVSAPAGTELYFCYEQSSRVFDFAPGEMNVVLRTRLPLATLAGDIRHEVATLDARLPLIDLRTMDEVFAESLSRPRLLARLLAAFAGLALLLAAVGAYGVLSYSVAERRREIGVRMALGADRRSVLGLVLRDGLLLAGVGLALGLAGALATSRAASSLLFGVGPADPVSFLAVMLTMAVVAFAACLLPARRAASVDPVVVLRDE